MSNKIVLTKGLDLPISGQAELRVAKTVTPDIVAICPTDFAGLTPRLLVKEGDNVLCGSPVLADKKNPSILISSPVSGVVKEIVRGEKRKLLAVLIQADIKQQGLDFGKKNPKDMDASQIKTALLESGLWPFIIQRPYGIVAKPEDKPKAIFISAFDSAPLASAPEYTLAGRIADIQTGIDAIAKLTDGKVHIGLSAANPDSPFGKLEGVSFHLFEGKHPAGNVGVQISHVCPVTKGSTVWTVSLQGLAAIGALFKTGKLNLRRKIAVAGPAAIQAAYADALPGTPMSSFFAFFGNNDDIRIVSGNILSGKTVGKEGYLGFYSNEITVLKEGTQKELFGWLNPLRFKVYSQDRSAFNWLLFGKKYDMDTNLHGGPRAFVMSDNYYSKVLPMDIYPLYLIKACLAGDIDKMEQFGIYEVIPEDLALCEYIDPSKNYIQKIIADGISLMLKEME
jgi:Na+-transporting NADH:ubiquinone oxidoreductase subunit A